MTALEQVWGHVSVSDAVRPTRLILCPVTDLRPGVMVYPNYVVERVEPDPTRAYTLIFFEDGTICRVSNAMVEDHSYRMWCVAESYEF